ncbi:MAG: hypothetical protein U1F41_13950 [Burkholderiales bacterium]
MIKLHGFVGGIVAAALLAACASTVAQTGARAKTCPGNSCDVEVRVKMVGGMPTIEIDADELRFPRGNSDATIVWKLKDSPEWRFKETSIAPHTAAPKGDKQTTSANEWRSQIRFLNNSAVNYVVENANNRPARLYYNITVYKKSDDSPVTLDPAITNDGL